MAWRFSGYLRDTLLHPFPCIFHRLKPQAFGAAGGSDGMKIRFGVLEELNAAAEMPNFH